MKTAFLFLVIAAEVESQQQRRGQYDNGRDYYDMGGGGMYYEEEYQETQRYDEWEYRNEYYEEVPQVRSEGVMVSELRELRERVEILEEQLRSANLPAVPDEEMSLLEMFGAATSDFVLTKLLPRTHPECRWHWAKAVCVPKCKCRLAYRWGDLTMSRACRLITDEEALNDPECDADVRHERGSLEKLGDAIWTGTTTVWHNSNDFLQQAAPPSDDRCDFSWRTMRCEPQPHCAFRYKFGDYHLGRSCRRLDPVLARRRSTPVSTNLSAQEIDDGSGHASPEKQPQALPTRQEDIFGYQEEEEDVLSQDEELDLSLEHQYEAAEARMHRIDDYRIHTEQQDHIDDDDYIEQDDSSTEEPIRTDFEHEDQLQSDEDTDEYDFHEPSDEYQEVTEYEVQFSEEVPHKQEEERNDAIEVEEDEDENYDLDHDDDLNLVHFEEFEAKADHFHEGEGEAEEERQLD